MPKPNIPFHSKTFKLRHFNIDWWLLSLIIINMLVGLAILYSGSNQNEHIVIMQGLSMIASIILMLICANIKPSLYERLTPLIFSLSVLAVLAVVIFGVIDKGARRWLDLGGLNIQPSELLLLTVPMMMAYVFSAKPLPPRGKTIWIALAVLFIPALLVIKQPDLGTGMLIILSGICLFIVAGASWRLFVSAALLIFISTPLLWHFMHGYQKQRVLTFLHPESDPLGAGYHIIQSKIAIGSGGFWGKGWLHGTQAHLAFLPEHSTDFIFSVAAEELGFIFCLVFLVLLVVIFARCLYLSLQAQTSYTRLLSAALSINFLLYALINIAMVSGLLPVVGVPLVLVSHGGSSILSSMLSFGLIMSCTRHKQFMDK
jgi:rod shape determining protein RodA